MRAAAVAALLFAGCGSSSDEPAAPPAKRTPVPDTLSGTLALDGAPLALASCRPGREQALYVDLVTKAGALRFLADGAMTVYWNPAPAADTRGEPLPCTKLDRSWGGATRSDGTSYFRGTLALACGRITGEVTVDCGDITPVERAGLDAGRRSKQDELRRDAAKP